MGWIVEVLNSSGLWVTLFVLLLIGAYTMVPGLKQLVNGLGGRKKAMWISAIAFLFVGGHLAGFGVGNLFGNVVATTGAGEVRATAIEITTDFASDNGCTITEDGSVKNYVHMRCTDAQSNATNTELDAGIITVYRGGSLTPGGCEVSFTTDPFRSPSDSSDNTMYKIWNRNSLGEGTLYLAEGGAAGTSDKRESLDIGFTEGQNSETVGIELDIDEAASDELNANDGVMIHGDVCGQPLIIEFVDTDAAA